MRTIMWAAAALTLAAVGTSARADGDCAYFDKDDASWIARHVTRGASVIVDCDGCSASPIKVKRAEVKKGGDPSTRVLHLDGRETDVSTIYVQTGDDTWTNVGVLIGCAAPSDAATRHTRERRRHWVGGSGDSTGVPACDAYVAATERYLQCDKLPVQAKDAMRQSMDAMRQGFSSLRDPNVPKEAIAAAADACKQATDAIQQSAAAMGCSL